jgi:hypothetical protein
LNRSIINEFRSDEKEPPTDETLQKLIDRIMICPGITLQELIDIDDESVSAYDEVDKEDI